MLILRPWSLWLSGLVLLVLAGLSHAQTPALAAPATGDPLAAQLIGRWEVIETKEPGKPYEKGYKGRPFVRSGPEAFTLIHEYWKDGTFKRITRVGTTETVHEGTWRLSGHELRHERQAAPYVEVMYIRFDSPDQYTSIDVYEGTPDPGLFGRFQRIK